MATSQARIDRVQEKHCPNSTDAGGDAANHCVREGACVICDRSVSALEVQHGLA